MQQSVTPLRTIIVLCLGSLFLLSPLSASAEEKDDLVFRSGAWGVDFGGYLRGGLVWVGLGGEREYDFIGQNNGLQLMNARLKFSVFYDDMVETVLSIEGAGDRRYSANQVSGDETVILKDAYTHLKFFDFLGVKVGQYKPPFDAEALVSTVDEVFIRSSVISEGVLSGEGVVNASRQGFEPGRQVGLSLLSERVDLGPVGLKYHLALTNGNSASSTRNDNDKLAYYGRVELHLLEQLLGIDSEESFVVLGGGAYFNEKTQGELPTLLAVEEFSWGADLAFDAFGAHALLQVLGRTKTYPDINQAEQESLGFMGELAYELPLEDLRFQFAYRYASLDPYKGDAEEGLMSDDSLQYHTLGLGYRLENVPLQVKFNYTMTQEEGGASLDNDLMEGMLQFAW